MAESEDGDKAPDPGRQPRPRDELADWANARDSWIRQTVSIVMANNGPLSPSQIDAVHEHLLLEKQLEQGEFEELPHIAGSGSSPDATQHLTLRLLDEVKNVNALVEGQSIEFSEQLTVLFGQNASGKTGYTRVLKRMANIRRAEEVLTNAKDHSSDGEPTARIAYSVGEDEHVLTWENELGVDPLTRISVFDTRVLDMHVDEGIGYVYTPSEIALFGHVSDGLSAIQDLLSTDSKRLLSGGNPFLSKFTVGSMAHTVVEQLTAATDPGALAGIAKLSPEEESERVSLQIDLPALQAGTLSTLVAAAKRQIRVGTTAIAQLEKVESFVPTTYNEALAQLRGARRAADDARSQFAAHDMLPDDLDEQWQSFIVAGDIYRQHLQGDKPHSDGDPCLYCRNPMPSEIVALANSYRSFLEDGLQKAVAQQEQDLALLCSGLDATAIASVARELKDLQEDAEEGEIWISEAHAFFLQVAAQISNTSTRQPIESWPDGGPEFLERLIAVLERLQKRADGLEKDAADSAEQIDIKAKRLKELSDRSTFEVLRPQIEAHLQGLKRGLALAEIAKRIRTTRTSLTELAKSVSSVVVNSRFSELFEEECEALRAPPDVTLKFPGESGKAKRQKQVASRKPSDVLSEGEQKVIGLADFLAECRMREIRAPIVFDDPVTSLDYRRLEEVAKRVSDLADQHQVIVFTHNIAFATALLDLRKQKKRRCSFFRIEDDGERKGLVSADVEPSMDSPTAIDKKIRDCLERAAGLDDDRLLRDALVNSAIDLLRRWLEAFVEQDLLAGIAKRHRANLQLGNLEGIKAEKLPDALAVVANAFNRTSRHLEGHSKTDEQINVSMTRAEVERLWLDLKELRSEFLA